MKNTPIEWTDDTWPVVNGCARVSPGCGGKVGEGGCYAERLVSTRLRHMPKYKGLAVFTDHGPHWTRESRLWIPDLDIPLRTKKPTKFFVANMGDLFFEEVTNEEIAAVFGVMAACPQHTFQVLTKRAKRMREWFEWETDRARGKRACTITAQSYLRGIQKDSRLYDSEYGPWPLPNVWLGVSVEDQKYADERIPHLLATPAAVRYVSYEPALGPVDFHEWMPDPHLRTRTDASWKAAAALNWVIVGGESGPGARPFDLAWARSTIEQCKIARVACFVKQLGTYPHVQPPLCRGWVPVMIKSNKGGDWSEWPEDLRVREFPEVRRA